LPSASRRRIHGDVLHLIKLSVGPKDVAQLRTIQQRRITTDPPLRHQTRVMPKRAAEIIEGGGSIFWVVSGFVRVRQRVLELREDRWDDGSACCSIILDPELVLVEARPQKPFQGWRYLDPAAAPPDVAGPVIPAEGIDSLPPRLRQELRELGLL
jgi:hypothetical protein